MGLTKAQIKNYKFPKSQQMERLLTFCVNSQGAFSKESFRMAGGTKMIERYWTKAGLMEKNPNSKDGFILTKKFGREYNKQIDPNKGCSRSGTTAVKHSEGLCKILLTLPKDITPDKIINETEAKRGDYNKPSESVIAQRENNIIKRINNDYSKITQAYRDAKQEDKTKLYYAVQSIEKLHGHIIDGVISRSPDMMVTFNVGQLQTFSDNMKEWYDSRRFKDGRDKEYAYQGIERMERLIAHSITTHQTEITISIEIITSSYGNDEIALHEHFREITGIEQIYVPA